MRIAALSDIHSNVFALEAVIGPIPWGDGIVDVQDLIVLAEHLFEEIPPPEPVE